jgi:hypothetical protein
MQFILAQQPTQAELDKMMKQAQEQMKKYGNDTYEVKDFALIFNYTDGRHLQLVFMGEGYDKKNQSPATVTMSFNNDTIYKK